MIPALLRQSTKHRLFPDFSVRSDELEIMDSGDCTGAELAQAYSELGRVNRFLGGTAAVVRPLSALIQSRYLTEFSILDIGAGASDIPRSLIDWGRANRYRVRCVALDLSDQALQASRDTLAGYPEVTLVRADALRLPFPPKAFDFATASMFFHHLSTPAAAEVLRALHGLVRVGFIVNDLHRHPVAYYAFWVLSRLFSRNRLIRNDGLVSILRGFTPEDYARLRALAGLQQLVTRRYFPYRVVLIGQHE